MTLDDLLQDKKYRAKWMGYRRSYINSIEIHEFYLCQDALAYIKKPDEELKARLVSRAESVLNSKIKLQSINQRLGE